MNINLTREELDKLIKFNDLERYTQQQFKQFVESNEEVLIKGEKGELDDIEKSEYDTLIAELQSFTTVNVFDTAPESKNRIIKSIEFIRPKQVEWDEIEKSEEGEEDLSKARAGTYTDTSLNRKLGRVGQKYGSKKQSADEGKSDIKTVSLSSKKGGGFTLNVKMSDGSMKHLPVDNKELASVKNSPVQKDGISKNRTLHELAQSKLSKQSSNSGKSEEGKSEKKESRFSKKEIKTLSSAKLDGLLNTKESDMVDKLEDGEKLNNEEIKTLRAALSDL